MKKAVSLLLALCVAASLCACGDMRDLTLPEATAAPYSTRKPYTTANPEDGIVKDDDGFIEDRDTGTSTAGPKSTAAPKTDSKSSGNAAAHNSEKN